MAGIGRYRLSDALRKPGGGAGEGKAVKPERTEKDTAEQTREAAESREAHTAEASIRDRMVAIGRGNQQAGRQGS
jgi:hypothetical protein